MAADIAEEHAAIDHIELGDERADALAGHIRNLKIED
jgi:hypothetical protein